MGGYPPAGLMQDWPLTTDRIIDHAARWHGAVEIVSRHEDGAITRSSYAALRDDAKRLSCALLAQGVQPGDRVATLAMNGAWHLACWYAISGIGAVCHTLNPRYSDEQLRYIVNHAEDGIILADGAFAPLLGRLLPDCPTVRQVVFLSPPAEPLPGAIAIEDFVAGQGTDCSWGDFPETTAAGLCYTSGTTGHPKGVLYSHRSNFLHTLFSVQPDMLALSARDTLMPVVPMFHANAWGMTFSAPYTGAKMVLPGIRLDGPSLCELLEKEAVTITAGVPTVWLGVLEHMAATGLRLPALRRVIIGGSAMPERMIHDFAKFGIEAFHAWGMTELSPLGSIATPNAAVAALPADQQLPYRLRQGRAPGGVEMRIVDEAGQPLPHDGQAMGALQLRGPTVARRYYRFESDALTADGWFDSGDIATIDEQGFMKVTDRSKDIIKSGGEWISSIDVENAASLHPSVALAAVVAMPHPKWAERPLLLVQLRPGSPQDIDDIARHLAESLPKWWLPDEIRIVDALPIGSTGKIDKKVLRASLDLR